MDNLEIVTEATGYGLGFLAKEFFCFTSIDTVKIHLRQAVNRVARAHFNFIAAALMGSHLSTLLSVSITCFVGDLIFWTVKELVTTISEVFRSIMKMAREAPKDVSLLKVMAKKVLQYAIYFFTCTLVSNSATSLVQPVVDFSLRVISKIAYSEFSSTAILSDWTGVFTPPATHLLGEIVGAIVSCVVIKFIYPTDV